MITLPDKLWECPWERVDRWAGGEPVSISVEALGREPLQLDWIVDVLEQIVQELNKEK